MEVVVARVRGFVGLSLVAMVGVLGLRVAHQVPRAASDPWARRPEVRVPKSHGWPPDDVEELTASARHQLGRVLGLRAR